MKSEPLIPTEKVLKKFRFNKKTIFLIGAALYLIYKFFLQQGEYIDETEKWRLIGDPKFRYEIYSAHVDNRTEVISSFWYLSTETPQFGVRITAIIPRALLTDVISCTFRHNSGAEKYSPSKEVVPFQSSGNQTFVIASVYCVLINDSFSYSEDEEEINSNPKFVALSIIGYENPIFEYSPTFTKINYNQPLKPFTLALCVTAISSDFQNSFRLIEFIELWKLLGVDHFYFYNLSAEPHIERLLTHYVDQGVATVLNWNLKGYEFDKELCDKGNCGIPNECLYRATFSNGYEFVLAVDLHQFIIPTTSGKNLKDFIKSLNQNETNIIQFSSVNNTAETHNYTTNTSLNIKPEIPTAVSENKYIVKGMHCKKIEFNQVSADDIKVAHVVKQTEASVLNFGDKFKTTNTSPQVSISFDNRLREYRERLSKAVETFCANDTVDNDICPFYT